MLNNTTRKLWFSFPERKTANRQRIILEKQGAWSHAAAIWAAHPRRKSTHSNTRHVRSKVSVWAAKGIRSVWLSIYWVRTLLPSCWFCSYRDASSALIRVTWLPEEPTMVLYGHDNEIKENLWEPTSDYQAHHKTMRLSEQLVLPGGWWRSLKATPLAFLHKTQIRETCSSLW